MRPHRRQPTRLLRPWDSPGKNTGVGCHFLLQCMKVKSESEVAQSCLTLCDPWTAAYQAPPPMGFSRQESWSRVLLPSLVGTMSACQIIKAGWWLRQNRICSVHFSKSFCGSYITQSRSLSGPDDLRSTPPPPPRPPLLLQLPLISPLLTPLRSLCPPYHSSS